MRRVRIDFAPPGVRRALHRTPRSAWVLAGAALALCILAGWRTRGYLAQVRAYQAQLSMLAARARAPSVMPVAARQPSVPAAQAAAVNEIILRLNLPWGALRDAVQAATTPNVALLALEPDARKHSLRISAEARGSDEMIDYVEQLQRQDWFSGVALAHHEINDLDPNHPMRFQVDAQWRAP